MPVLIRPCCSSSGKENEMTPNVARQEAERLLADLKHADEGEEFDNVDMSYVVDGLRAVAYALLATVAA